MEALAVHPYWLSELHQKNWDREDLKPSLFRTVEVTRAHYDAQERLNEKYSDRGSAQYDGTINDVLSDKLNILEPIAPTEAVSPRHANINGDEVDDGVINSLFPSTLSFLDLATLQLVNSPPRFPLLLFLRKEYHHISKLIQKCPQNGNGSCLAVSQDLTSFRHPGKTTYLYLKMIKSDRRPPIPLSDQ